MTEGTTGGSESSSPRRRTRSWWIAVLVLALAAGVAAVAIQRNVFPLYSGDHDEPVLRYQAEMLEAGVITIPRAQAEFFRPWLTGPHDERLVPAFQPLWPAVMAAADLATGSMLPAVALAAALLVVASFLLARELLASQARAALAAALVAACPLVLMLSGTYLSYVFAVALGTAFAFAALRGLRSGSRLLLVVAGVMIGLLFLTRPYDAVLSAIPLVAFAVLTHRHRWRELVAPAGWAALGFLPLLALALAYNVAVSGNPTTFATTVQSEGTSTFFWGNRSVAPDTPILEFTPSFSVTALGRNLWAMPTWLFGTYVALAAAVYGAVRLWRTDRPRAWLLLGMTFVFPLGYMLWWASGLTVEGAITGLGPHYYVPMVVPLAILTAHGTAELAARLGARRTAILAVGGVLAVVLTVGFVLPKLADKDRVTSGYRADAEAVRAGTADSPGPALVIQERRRSPYVMEPWPFLANDPHLDNEVLYAIDRGAASIDLLDRHPQRTPYRLVRVLQPGGDIDRPPLEVRRQTVLRGETVVISAEITNTTGAPRVTAYLRWRDTRAARLLDDASTKGATYHVTWTISPSGVRFSGADAPETRYPRQRSRRLEALKGTTPAPPYDLAVGASYARSAGTRDPDRSERDYYGRVADTADGPQVQVLEVGEQWTRLGEPFHAWLPISVAANLRVDMRAEPAG